MTVVYLQMGFAGQDDGTNPRLGRMVSTDILTTLLTPGYLSNFSSGQAFRPTDMILANYSNGAGGIASGLFSVSITGGEVTLSLIAGQGSGGGDVINPPLNLIATAADTTFLNCINSAGTTVYSINGYGAPVSASRTVTATANQALSDLQVYFNNSAAANYNLVTAASAYAAGSTTLVGRLINSGSVTVVPNGSDTIISNNSATTLLDAGAVFRLTPISTTSWFLELDAAQSDYIEFNGLFTFFGPFSVNFVNQNLNIRKNGKQVTFNIPALRGTLQGTPPNTTNITLNSASQTGLLPAAFIPSTTIYLPIGVYADSSTFSFGLCEVDTTGQITISSAQAGTSSWTGSNAGCVGTSVSYSTSS